MFEAKRIFDIDQALLKSRITKCFLDYHETYDFDEHFEMSLSMTRPMLHEMVERGVYQSEHGIVAVPPRFNELQGALESFFDEKLGNSVIMLYLHVAPYLEWRRKSRVCYTIHEGLSDDFKDMQDVLKIDAEHLKHLPHNEMYFDLRTFGLRNKKSEIPGAFVKVITTDDCATVFIGFYDSKINSIVDGGNCSLIRDEDGMYTVDLPELVTLEQKAMYYTFALLIYLCSDENDVAETIPVTGNKNKNNGKHNQYIASNKPKEYQVGYRIGPKLQYAKKKYESLCQSGNNKMRPHVRRGHWSHYWVGRHGTADRRRIIKWVSKQYINCENAEMIDIVDSLVDDTVHSKAV